MQRLGKVAWFARVNSGGAFTGKRFVSFYTLYHNNLAARTKGIADIILQLANGRFAALEIKAHKGIATPEQLAFIDTVNTHGGKAAIVRSISDVYTLLFQE